MQSSESGGHGASQASLVSFIPELVDHVNEVCKKLDISPAVPVAAAGGITDARQVVTPSTTPNALSIACMKACMQSALWHASMGVERAVFLLLDSM